MFAALELQPEEESQEKQQLYEACLKGSREEISRMVQNGNGTSNYFSDGMLPTHVVALAGRKDAEAILDMMLQNGFDVNARTKSGDDTLLHLVVENVNVKDAFPLVLKILEYSPDLNIRNRKLRTPYDIALARGQFEMAETLDGHLSAKEARDFYLEKIGALYGEVSRRMANAMDSVAHYLPLCFQRTRELAHYALRKVILIRFNPCLKKWHPENRLGSDLEEAQQKSCSALESSYAKLVEAVIDSKEKDIEEYIKLGADPNFVNEHKNGAIHYCVSHCTLPPFRTLSSLIDAGADVNLLDAEGDTALNLIIKSAKLRDTGDMYRCAELLVQQGALSTYKDLDGNDALTLAKKKNYTDIIRLLSGRRTEHIQPSPEPEPEPEDDFEHPPPGFMEYEEPPDDEIERQAQVNQERQELLHQESDVTHQPPRQVRRRPRPPPPTRTRSPPRPAERDLRISPQTHLINAVRFEGLDQVQVALQDHQADPNKASQEGLYPLHLAVMRQEIDEDERQDIIAALIEAGADVNAKTPDSGDSALHLAATYNQPESAKQLLDTHKCNYNDKNMDGKTAYVCAEEESNQEVMDIIENHRKAVRDKLRRGAKKASICNIL